MNVLCAWCYMGICNAVNRGHEVRERERYYSHTHKWTNAERRKRSMKDITASNLVDWMNIFEILKKRTTHNRWSRHSQIHTINARLSWAHCVRCVNGAMRDGERKRKKNMTKIEKNGLCSSLEWDYVRNITRHDLAGSTLRQTNLNWIYFDVLRFTFHTNLIEIVFGPF